MSARPLDAVLEPLQGVTQHGGYWKAKCPAHEDHHASLSISVGRDDRVIFYCHAGCDSREVLARLNMDWADLFPEGSGDGDGRPDMVVAEYEYRDYDGALLFVVERRVGKRFIQRRPLKDGTWSWKLDGCKRVLYRARQVRDAIRQNRYVFLVEGEKDVHTLEAQGLVATCNAGGAGKWRDEYTQALAGGKVVVLPDNDEPGQAHATMLMGQLAKKCRSFQIIELPDLPPKGDVTDWFSSGGTASELKRMVLACGQTKIAKPTFIRRASEYQVKRTDFLWWPRIPKGEVTVLAGPQGASKSYLTLALAACLSRGGCLPDGGVSPMAALQGHEPASTLIISYEDDVEKTVVPRLIGLDADLDRIVLLDRRDEETGLPRFFRVSDLAVLRAALEAAGDVRLLVIDPAGSLMVGQGQGAENSEAAVRGVLEPLTQLARERDLAVLIVKHVNKDSSTSAVMRVGGSGAWTQLPRSVLICGSDPEDPTHKGLQHVKANLTHRADPVDYWVRDTFTWGRRCVGSEAERIAVRELLKVP